MVVAGVQDDEVDDVTESDAVGQVPGNPGEQQRARRTTGEVKAAHTRATSSGAA